MLSQKWKRERKEGVLAGWCSWPQALHAGWEPNHGRGQCPPFHGPLPLPSPRAKTSLTQPAVVRDNNRRKKRRDQYLGVVWAARGRVHVFPTSCEPPCTEQAPLDVYLGGGEKAELQTYEHSYIGTGAKGITPRFFPQGRVPSPCCWCCFMRKKKTVFFSLQVPFIAFCCGFSSRQCCLGQWK